MSNPSDFAVFSNSDYTTKTPAFELFDRYNFSSKKSKRLAFVQADPNNLREPFSGSSEIIAERLHNDGYRVVLFHSKDLKHLPLTAYTPVRGSVRTVRLALAQLGLPQPENIDIPKSLRKQKDKFLGGRKVWETTIGELEKMGGVFHIKPLLYQKAFNGRRVCFSNFDQVAMLKCEVPGMDKNYKVLASTLCPIIGGNHWEARVLVQGDRFYTSRDKHSDDANFVRDALKAIREDVSWSSFVIDIAYGGWLNETPSIIEINDSLTTGYGQSSGFYYTYEHFYRAFMSRWKQVTEPLRSKAGATKKR